MAAHQMQRYPPCEALRMAMQKTVEWAMSPSPSPAEIRGPSQRPINDLDRPVASKRGADRKSQETKQRRAHQPTVAALKGNKTLCKGFNDSRDCQKAKMRE